MLKRWSDTDSVITALLLATTPKQMPFSCGVDGQGGNSLSEVWCCGLEGRGVQVAAAHAPVTDMHTCGCWLNSAGSPSTHRHLTPAPAFNLMEQSSRRLLVLCDP